ncbi:MFS general substrate transporter [Gonapodya prolifera JEL478]|uniref:MFS general substrate transporter n=1 Tax=Gonapodya prolifera (strain JEL478) TaxID=1344416 RepID=A0A139A7T8_GONPJ|nr:MFS general substrate transporter [Gonapodya prolifera JEL478]|eukprot:KXS12850.1 MFS general substrate transporter [Gonapodya prolifera JEL478]
MQGVRRNYSASSDASLSTGYSHVEPQRQQYSSPSYYNGDVKFGDAALVLPDWTPSEETNVMRKVDLALIPWLTVCYTALNVDRNNISAAVIVNAETPTRTMAYQLGLDGNKFNWALSAFFFGYVLLEIPSNLLVTRFNPSRWIARIMTSWGILAACLGAVQNFSGLLVVRALVGCMEAGFSPGTALYLSFWYKKYEVSSRWAYMFGGAQVISSFGGVVAYGVASMDGIGGISGWRWLFILEGAASAVLGVLTWFLLPDYPQTSRFLTTREKEIVIGRLPPSGPSVAAKQMIMVEAIDTFKDWKMYALSFALMLTLITAYGIVYFIPSVIKAMGFLSTDAQLLTVPPILFASIWIIVVNWSSDSRQEKMFHGFACLLPAIVGYFLLATIQPKLTDYGRYGLLFLAVMSNALIPLIIGLSTITTKGTTRTAVRSAFTMACGNIGGAIGGQVYQLDDAPLYQRGHWINGIMLVAVLVLLVIAVVGIIYEGEYVGRKANLTVHERGGLELDGGKFLDVQNVLAAEA